MTRAQDLIIATWNINSVRLRIDQVLAFLEAYQPHVLTLQEIRCVNDAFPAQVFRRAGYAHMAVRGQKSHHGVAIVSRLPLKNIRHRTFCGVDEARHVCAVIADADIEVHSLYVPAGGDVPDPAVNPKFAHKLAFLRDMRAWLSAPEGHDGRRMVLTGDFNVAPEACDVWDTKKLARVVTHTPVERAALKDILACSGMVDVVRARFAPPRPVFTWWSYRAGADWQHFNRGRRLDHVWASPALARYLADASIATETRAWPRPSDHVPVLARFSGIFSGI